MYRTPGRTRLTAVGTSLLLVALTLSTPANGQRIDNFVLLDHRGEAHELHYAGGAKAVVLMSQANQCAHTAATLHNLQQLAQTFADQDVRFLLINSSVEDDRAALAATAAKHKLTMPILDDRTQLIGEALNLTAAGQLLVVDANRWELVYQGNAADPQQLQQASAALTALTSATTRNPMPSNGDDSVTTEAHSADCTINYPARNADHTQISYSDTIAPLLEAKCAVCHRPGGIGPWAMNSYTMVRGFAPMMREVIRTKRMPPWHADPHIGTWKGDRSLTVDETRTLVHWIEAGAPRGNGPDPLLKVAAQQDNWPLGKPDLVLELPAFTVPASGVVDYQFPVVKNPLDKAVWVKAATVVPGDRSVVHHVLVGAADGPAEDRENRESVFDNYIIGYAPGNESSEMPAGTGVYIPKGGDFLFQLHYTPTGKETVDKTRLGLYFAQTPPRNFYRHNVVLDPTIRIPPHAAKHEEAAYYEFHREALLHAVVPHAHYRGRASRFELHHTDGRIETLLSVPNYDFNWQRTYEFAEPKRIPAGARLVHATEYDNSEHNPGNPAPERAVPWGLQSWDEMLYGAFSYTWVDETSDQPIHDKLRADTTQMVGFMDRNMDGKLVWSELPQRMKKRLVQGFKAVDGNGDGGLDIDEFIALRKHQQKARQAQRAAGDVDTSAR